MKQYLKKRPWNFAAVALVAAGFWLQFRAFSRLESLFAEGSLAMGFAPNQMGWFNEHQGQIGVLCLTAAVILYVKDHHNETRQ